MEIKVRAIEGSDNKSVQEVEKELLEKHEEQFEDTTAEEVTVVEGTETTESKEEVTEESSLTDEDVLSYIGKRYGKEINSFDELMAEREASEELPEDVSAYFKYKKETGRGMEDYMKLQRDFDSMEEDQLLAEYYLSTEEGIDKSDALDMVDDFDFDEDLDEEKEIKKLKLAKKKELAKAKKFFNEQKDMYKQPLESSTVGMSDEARKEQEAYKQYLEEAKSYQEENRRKSDWFLKKTNEVFNNEFKGFEFKLDDRKVTYSPGDAEELKKAQNDIANFYGKYLDDKGLLSDPQGYHRALSIAMNPDRFAKFFYEQGKSEAVEDVLRKQKNVTVNTRRAPEVVTKGGMKIRSVNPDSGRGLKIRSIKRK
mgnify:CR=1 FL=1|tara:strand:+ start:3517 stop:4620 length:1104 start_codon:yes stop_codon:yes gene_type:complete